jgi:hypothetical protein
MKNELVALHLWGGPTQKFIPLCGEAAVTASGKTRSDHRRDVAIVTLASETVQHLQEANAVFAEPSVLTNEPQRGELCAIAGYPVEANEPTDLTTGANRVRIVRRELHIFFVAEADARGYRRAHANPDSHFVAPLDLERALPLPPLREGTPPSSIGLSGGGVFSFGSLRSLIDGTCKVALIGIGIEYIARKKLVVAASDKVLASGLLRVLERRPL